MIDEQTLALQQRGHTMPLPFVGSELVSPPYTAPSSLPQSVNQSISETQGLNYVPSTIRKVKGWPSSCPPDSDIQADQKDLNSDSLCDT
ncbi:hypothetical protein E2C01_053561 [Portunus trituberculatus]|uniref:Uncharacterized protein n=1 Tax=Portunus trituberculatus TaxID=210409 RepID=A0A5B7GR43_PORTR|nr:hypothetical protein [Portunus trituberculatus]